MPGAQTVTVDGVEPSILVKLHDISDNPGRVKIFTADDGTERYLVKGDEEPTLVTSQDLGVLGVVSYEIVDGQKAAAKGEPEPGEAQTVTVPSPGPKSAGEPFPFVNPPGQPGQ